MKVSRIKYFSNKLPDSRIGIGWIQEKNDKVKSEKYFEAAKKAADENFDESDPDKAIRKSKNAVTKKVILEESPEPIGKAIGYGAVGYGISKFPEYVNKGLDYFQETKDLPKIPEKATRFLKKNSGKIAGSVALGTLIYHSPKIKRKVDAARTGAEINTRDRIKKYNKKNDSTKK